MKSAPEYITYHFQPETLAALNHLFTAAPGSLDAQSSAEGVNRAEPLLIIADCLIRLSKAYAARFGQPVREDYVARPEVSSMLSSLRGLLTFDGVAAWEVQSQDKPCRDTKDNATLEALVWKACEIAGIDGDTL